MKLNKSNLGVVIAIAATFLIVKEMLFPEASLWINVFVGYSLGYIFPIWEPTE